ncbi:MAG: hypothetical protein M1834_009522 [Cirrosporium novae-zelandiae]|nr:MAG: hypothetical protein M1834_009522 [Cirrosporium novae-zelandiae]
MSTDFKSPRVNILQDHPSCHDGLYYMIAPRGNAVQSRGPMILDESGSMVWRQDGYGDVYGLKVQQYKGEDYLTFWAGNDAVGGHGAGFYYMLDQSYNERYKLGAAQGLDGDLHEFLFTGEGTALITVYQIVQHDLTAIGKSATGYIWDGIIQEIDIETGELKFMWRASEHYKVEESFFTAGGTSSSDPLDFFHINSIEKDPKGNYLISSRYMHTVTYINGTDGEIIWKLGGKNSDFEDISSGEATNFAWQHHARWHDDYSTITLFDNGARAGLTTADYARGMWIKLDFEKMTAELKQAYINPKRFISSSQGSLQVLNNGHVLVGYGFNGVFTEFDEDGTVLCDTHFEAASSFESGNVQSYRAYKQAWKGYPTDSPAIKVDHNIVYMSWNGATEVSSWVIEGANSAEPADMEFYQVKTVRRAGFETLAALDDNSGSYVRVTAIDDDGNVLGYSDIVESGQSKADRGLHLTESDTIPLKVMCGFVAIMGIGIIIWEIRTGLRLARRNRKISEDNGDSEDEAGAPFMLASRRSSSEISEV